MKAMFSVPLIACLISLQISDPDKRTSTSAGASPASQPTESVERIDLTKDFAGFEACFLAYDVEERRTLVFNEARSQQRFPPCSTFKVPHALIALDLGVLDGPDHTLKWDGVKRWSESWNKDHSLRTAVRDSVLWYFQETARRIGATRMRDAVQRLDYGNGDCSGELDRFWLNGPLTISAAEQVRFLDRLRRDDLPFAKSVQKTVRELIVIESRGAYALRGKTGTRGENQKITLGWFVGWVERDGKALVFATNIAAADNAWGPEARDITRKILQKIGWGAPDDAK